MNFKKYIERQEIEELLKENEIELTSAQVDILLESGWMKRAGGLGRAALLASMPFAMSANWADNSSSPKPYHFSGEKMMANTQQMNDEAADKAYINAGGPEFKDVDAEKFLKFRKSPEHFEILKKAGLPSSYIPSSVRQFVYGVGVSVVEELHEESAEIKAEITRRFGRDSFVEVIESKDAKTGGAVLLIRANGVVMAMNEQDAVQRAAVVMTEIARDKGFEVDSFKNLSSDVSVKPASRSTVDFAAESSLTPVRFSISFRMRKNRSAQI